jgi:hypothetical protein
MSENADVKDFAKKFQLPAALSPFAATRVAPGSATTFKPDVISQKQANDPEPTKEDIR